ncbi:glycosyltransferase family 2 protein [Pseudomonas sp. Irchel s3h9]|uniref:glycosyltransferase family 2 protein n=1 Tax=Pseudomonas sp. Irchel s3h9 TaxID=2009192 RepID=UPI000BA4A8F5|nr:glycosyltransferase family 2 protein [Pseudomonas sp. Irchel s3h9]
MSLPSKRKISLVTPCYNEQNGIQAFFRRINEVFLPIADKYELEVVAVNDGSRDQTYNELVKAKTDNSYLVIVDLSRNFGKEAAISAGLDFATGDAVIPIDSDLQHPPEVILELIEKWESGAEVVLAKRVDRKTDRPIQKLTANYFYKLHNRISDIDIPADVGDFRLMDRKVIEALKSLPENCRFMKGLFAWVGFRTATVEYKVAPREHGTTSFNTWKLWNFALEGITSFSSAPLRVWTYLGCLVSALSFAFAVYLIVKTMFFGIGTPGYASIMVTVLFASGVQLIGIGVLGEYVGRIFAESKKRPVYIVRDVIK